TRLPYTTLFRSLADVTQRRGARPFHTWTRGSVIVILVLAVLLGEQIPFAEQLLKQLHGFSVIAPGCQMLGAQIAPVADKLNQRTQVQGQNAVFATGNQHQVVLLLLAPGQ